MTILCDAARGQRAKLDMKDLCYNTFSIELARGYGVNEFREDLKKLYHTAGIEGKQVVFLGEVPGMYTSDEKDKVCADIRDWVMAKGGNPTKARGLQKYMCGFLAARSQECMYAGHRHNMVVCCTLDACYSAFVQRVRDNLHIVLTMSPVGEGFRVRCRQFPSLISCSTIDWFTQAQQCQHRLDALQLHRVMLQPT
eukprot:scaffold10254_cov16-Tisochrysis_lutea.AAC.3